MIKHTLLFLFSIIVALLSVPYVGFIVKPLYATGGLGDYALGITGLFLTYLFFIPLIFEFLGNRRIYKWFLLIIYVPVFLYIFILSLAEYPYVWVLSSAFGFFFGYVLRKLKEFIIQKMNKKKAA